MRTFPAHRILVSTRKIRRRKLNEQQAMSSPCSIRNKCKNSKRFDREITNSSSSSSSTRHSLVFRPSVSWIKIVMEPSAWMIWKKSTHRSVRTHPAVVGRRQRRPFLCPGKAPKDAELKSMLEEAQGPINFTMLLTLFGDRLNGTDEENVILNAWKNFDQEGTGHINQKSLREVLTGEGRPEDRT
jgi:hypothetical protein